jgi:hypothetical protein
MRHILLLVALSLLSLPTYAQVTAGVNWKIVSASGAGHFCMDAAGNKKADGTKVFMYPCHGRENQRWTVTTDAEGTSALIGTGGYCLDVRGAGSGTGTPVQLYKCHFGKNQRFALGADGTIKEEGTGKCLQASADKEGAAIIIAPCTGNVTEKWKVEE